MLCANQNNTMYKSEIAILHAHFKKIKVDWRTSKSVMGQKLQSIMANNSPIAPENLWEPKGIPYNGLPYEKEYVFKL